MTTPPRENTDKGSYDFSSFSGSEEEYERLKVQALIAWELEKQALMQAGLHSGKQVVDIGCGPAFISRQIAEVVAPARVTGIEADQQLLSYAKLTQQGQDNLEVQAGDAYDLPLENSSYDFGYARFLYQHLRDPLKALQEARRVIRPGGVFSVVDVDDQLIMIHPQSDALQQLIAISETAQEQMGGDRFIGRKLPGMFRAAGFVEVQTHVIHVTTSQLGKAEFLKIISGFKLAMMQESEHREKIPELESEISKLGESDFDGTVGVFFVTGKVVD